MEKIVRVGERNIDELAQIDFESQNPTDRDLKLKPDSHKKELIERFKKKNETMFGYKIDQKIVGYVTFKKHFPGYNHAELYWIAIATAHQGKGIGTKLLTFAEDKLRKLGFRAVFLYTGKPMLLAQKFYTKNGYTFMNEFPGYYSKEYAKVAGSDVAVMYKKNM